MSFDAFIAAGWDAHADRPEAVAADLAASLARVEEPAQILPFARLAVHVFGEHLGDWTGGVAVLESMRGLPAFDGSPAVAAAIARGVATLRYAGGDPAALAALEPGDRVAVLAGASSALAGRKDFDGARHALDAAQSALPADADPRSLAVRALAIGGNNLAAALLDAPSRSDAENDTMVDAARVGLAHWRLAGTWLEEERAHWRLAACLVAARRYDDAVRSARDGVDVCELNAAPAFELFFTFEVLARALHGAGDKPGAEAAIARAMAAHDGVAQDQRAGCASALATLGALAADR